MVISSACWWSWPHRLRRRRLVGFRVAARAASRTERCANPAFSGGLDLGKVLGDAACVLAARGEGLPDRRG